MMMKREDNKLCGQTFLVDKKGSILQAFTENVESFGEKVLNA